MKYYSDSEVTQLLKEDAKSQIREMRGLSNWIETFFSCGISRLWHLPTHNELAINFAERHSRGRRLRCPNPLLLLT